METFKKLKEMDARLMAITAIDSKTLLYHFSIDGKLKNVRLRIKNNKTKSICALFPNAEFYEREIFEMFGIEFEGNPNLKGLFLQENVRLPFRKL